MANALTFCRIICGLLLLGFPVFSPEFYGFYLLGGITDILDGAIARKTLSLLSIKSNSSFNKVLLFRYSLSYL